MTSKKLLRSNVLYVIRSVLIRTILIGLLNSVRFEKKMISYGTVIHACTSIAMFLKKEWVLKPDRPDEGICLANCASSLITKYFGK